jgi:hypothetical protein
MGLNLALVGQAHSAQSPSVTQKSYVQKARSQIDAITTGLSKLDKKIAQLNFAERSDCHQTLKRLRCKEKLAREHLETMRKAPAERWMRLRPALDARLINLQKSYQQLINRYFR